MFHLLDVTEMVRRIVEQQEHLHRYHIAVRTTRNHYFHNISTFLAGFT